MQPHIIQCLLKERGISQSDLAKVLGVTSGAVGAVISGNSKSEKIERAISKALKMPVTSIFPLRYDTSGQVVRVRRRVNPHYDPSKSLAELAAAVAKIQATQVAA